MAIVSPLDFVGAGIVTLIDAIKVDIGAFLRPVTREVVSLGDDADFSGTPYVVRINKGSLALFVDETCSGTVPVRSTSSIAIETGAGSQPAKNGSGVLFAIVVTTPGETGLLITDGPTGNVIAVVPAGQPLGDVPMHSLCGVPFQQSLYVYNPGNAPFSPAVTLIYA